MGQPLSEAVNLPNHPTKVSYCFSKHPLYGMAAWLDLFCCCGQSSASPLGADSLSLSGSLSLSHPIFTHSCFVFEKPRLACNPGRTTGMRHQVCLLFSYRYPSVSQASAAI